MQLAFQKSVCKYVATALRQIKDQEFTQELRLPEDLPDVGRVVACWGQPVLRGKQWMSDSISFSGGVQVWVLYQPVQGDALQQLESWIPIQMKWDMPPQSVEGQIRIQCLLRQLDARSLSARKLMLRAGIAALGEALVADSEEYGVPGTVPEDVHLLKNTYPLRLPREAGEKPFPVEEELSLTGTDPMPEALIYYTAEPKLTENKVLGDKLVLRGYVNVHTLYRSEEEKLHSRDFTIPFAQFSQLEGHYSGDAQADVRMAVTTLELDKDGEDRLRVKCGLLAQYLIDDRELVELVEDAYSPDRQVTVQTQPLDIPAILEQKQQLVPMEQTLRQDATQILDVDLRQDFCRLRRGSDRVELELPGQFQVLYIGEDGGIQSATAKVEGSMTLPAGEGCCLHGALQPGDRPTAAVTAGGIGLRGESGVMLTCISDSGIPAVSGLELGDKRQPDLSRPSLILRRTGQDRLWDIAKSTGSTVEAIRKANSLEGEPAAGRVLLIPVS